MAKKLKRGYRTIIKLSPVNVLTPNEYEVTLTNPSRKMAL